MRTPGPGSIIGGKYKLERVLRESRASLVAAAKHRHLGSKICIKLMRGEMIREPGYVARFLREGQLCAQLRSDHVVRILDVGVADDEGTPFIAMELLEGCDVAHAIASSGAMPAAKAAEVLIDACEAIVEAHAMSIIHRDIKPSNLFLARGSDGSPFVKVLDFGIASTCDSADDVRMTSTQDIMGTPLYMSPEVMESALKADARSDIWALGATLYEMLTGQVPFAGFNMVEVYSIIQRSEMILPRKVKSEIPEAVEAVVVRCLSRDPAARFPSVVEFVEALAKAALPESEAASRIDRIRRISSEASLRARAPRQIVSTPPGAADTYGPTVGRAAALARRARKNAMAFAMGVAVLIVLLAAVVLLRRGGAGAPQANSGAIEPSPAACVNTSGASSSASSVSPTADDASAAASVSAPPSEAAISTPAPSAPASATPRARPAGPSIPKRRPESDFATDPHR